MSELRPANADDAETGHPEAWLGVVAGNERARRSYAREGWTDEARSSTRPASTAARWPSRPIATEKAIL